MNRLELKNVYLSFGGVKAVQDFSLTAKEGQIIGIIGPNNAMMIYNENAEHLDEIYLTEKLGQKAGWQSVFLEENIMRGYLGELRNFLSCLISGQEPEAGFQLARDSIRVIYAAYRAAQEHHSVTL